MSRKSYEFGVFLGKHKGLATLAGVALVIYLFVLSSKGNPPWRSLELASLATQPKVVEECETDAVGSYKKAQALMGKGHPDMAFDLLHPCRLTLSQQARALYVNALVDGNAQRAKIADLEAQRADTTDGWHYLKIADDMTSKMSETARIESDNSLNLPRPYSGKNHGTLMVIKDKQRGLIFGLSVEQGQIICETYDGCRVAFRFDDAQPITFHAVRTADYSSTHLVFRDGRRFVAAAAKAKRILAQITMYQAGEQVFEFHTNKPLEVKLKK